jgi:hypothetical protein
MESSTLCKDAKQEHKRKCSNPSLSNPTKATNAMEVLERKNKGWRSTNDSKILIQRIPLT